MTAIQLRAELFREVSPLLDSEAAMLRILAFIRSLSQVKRVENDKSGKSYKVIPVFPEIRRWSGCASFTEDEIDSDPRLKAILSR